MFVKKWNHKCCFCLLDSSLTPGPVYWREWGEGRVFASSMCPVRRLVWQWTFIVLLADQHRKRFCLAGASTCFSVGAPNQFVSFGTLCSMFDVLAVCAPNQFVSFGTLCSMFDVLAVCAPNQFVSFGTLCSVFHVRCVSCWCAKPVRVIRHSVFHVRCVSCLCPKTVSASWYSYVP